MFINGTQVATAAQTGSISPSNNPLWIGGNSPYGEYFNGLIDEVRVYRVARAEPDIQADMATPVAPNPNAPKLVITSPAEAATVAGGTVNITYTTAGDLTGVDHVHFQVDGDPVQMDLSLDGTYSFSGVHVGSHTLNGWLVRGPQQDRWHRRGARSFLQRRGLDPTDPARPTVGITAPANGATVNSIVSITANAPTTWGSTACSSSSTGCPSASRTVPLPTRSTGTLRPAETARTC